MRLEDAKDGAQVRIKLPINSAYAKEALGIWNAHYEYYSWLNNRLAKIDGSPWTAYANFKEEATVTWLKLSEVEGRLPYACHLNWLELATPEIKLDENSKPTPHKDAAVIVQRSDELNGEAIRQALEIPSTLPKKDRVESEVKSDKSYADIFRVLLDKETNKIQTAYAIELNTIKKNCDMAVENAGRAVENYRTSQISLEMERAELREEVKLNKVKAVHIPEYHKDILNWLEKHQATVFFPKFSFPTFQVSFISSNKDYIACDGGNFLEAVLNAQEKDAELSESSNATQV